MGPQRIPAFGVPSGFRFVKIDVSSLGFERKKKKLWVLNAQHQKNGVQRCVLTLFVLLDVDNDEGPVCELCSSEDSGNKQR